MHRGSLSGSAADGESGGDAIGTFAHAANTEAGRFAGDHEAATIVLDHEFKPGFLVCERKNKRVGMRVADRVGNGFLANAKKRIGYTQGKCALAAGTDSPDSNGRAAVDHAVRAFFKSMEKPHGLQVLGTQRRNAAASFFMAVSHHIAGYIELRQNARFLAGFIVNGFKLKAKAGKALCQRVMHLLCQTFAFFQNCL
jgi:hypothetical protein